MKTYAVLLVAAILLLQSDSAAAAAKSPFEQRCERELAPNISVEARELGYSVDNTVSSKQLHHRASHASLSNMMLGMTATQARVEVMYDGRALQGEGGAECLAPHITVELRYLPMAIYVAREFPSSSCSFRAVLAHELRHVDIYRAHLPGIAQRIRTALQARYAHTPVYASAGLGLEVLGRQVDDWLRPLIRDELARVELAQEAMDSMEETYSLSSACHGELAYNLATQM